MLLLRYLMPIEFIILGACPSSWTNHNIHLAPLLDSCIVFQSRIHPRGLPQVLPVRPNHDGDSYVAVITRSGRPRPCYQ